MRIGYKQKQNAMLNIFFLPILMTAL